MQIKVVNAKIFQIDGKSYTRGDFAVEYENQAVRLKNKLTSVYVNSGSIDWSKFTDSNDDVYEDFEAFTTALVTIISTADADVTAIGDSGIVTQITSITTGVTLNNSNGIVTTVASTLAADASANFTVTNSKVLAGSNILTNVIYAGAGNAEAKIVSVAAGSFVVKLTNTGTVALDAVVKVGFLVI